jgi:hypothetical protein
MRTVLIAHQDTDYASRISAGLLEAGYRTITCPGPWPPALRCIRCDVGYCPLTEGADLLIYDPELVARDGEGALHTLAVDTGRAHPDVPVLLAWASEEEPGIVAAIRAEVPRIGVAAKDPRALAAQVTELVGPPMDPSIVPLHY